MELTEISQYFHCDPNLLLSPAGDPQAWLCFLLQCDPKICSGSCCSVTLNMTLPPAAVPHCLCICDLWSGAHTCACHGLLNSSVFICKSYSGSLHPSMERFSVCLDEDNQVTLSRLFILRMFFHTLSFLFETRN